MKNNTFVEILKDADEKSIAVGAVNIFNYLTVDAAVSAANEIGSNLIIQTSAGTVKNYGADRLFSMIHSIRKYSEVKVALHLDHCRDKELGKLCVNAGWDGIMMDFSHLPLKENISHTKEMADYAHSYNVAIEGEVGVISGAEEDIVSDNAVSAGYDETVEFIDKTGVDAIAPSIGTAHGAYRSAPKLDFELVERLGKLETPVVIHGGSGLTPETFSHLIQLGGRKVNISTIVKETYLSKVRELSADTNISPLEFDNGVKKAVQEKIREHLLVFGK